METPQQRHARHERNYKPAVHLQPEVGAVCCGRDNRYTLRTKEPGEVTCGDCKKTAWYKERLGK